MLERLIGEYSDKGFRFAFRLCGNSDEAKDLLQDAFLRVFQKWNRYDVTQPFSNYFLTILRHIYCDHLKRQRVATLSLDAPMQKGESPAALGEMVADREEPILDRLMRQETTRTVGKCLREISPEHRVILTLCDMEGLSYEAIAVVLDCPVGTVKSRICRARTALKEKLIARLEVPL